jgi:HAD superfamily hydrolase (TIGR01509 family)
LSLSHIRTVLFDFDGIIVDTEWAIYEEWHQLFREHGHPLPLETYNQCIGTDFDTWSPKTHLEELTGNSFDWHQLDESRNVEIRRNLEGAGLIPGVEEAVAAAERLGLKRAVVSSSSHDWVDGWLEKLEVAPRFQTTVCRGDAPRIKPAPDLYLEAARRLETDPSGCLVLEDSVNGSRAAKDAGMTVLAVPNRVTACCDFSLADGVISSLAELPALLDRAE